MSDKISASDLVGCRYRLVQRRAHPEIPRTHAAEARAERFAAARELVMTKLATKRGPGDGKALFKRIDLGSLPAPDPDARYLDTLEALAAGATMITGAVLESSARTLAGKAEDYLVNVDVLVKDAGPQSKGAGAQAGYIPVIVSNHRAARRHATATTPAVNTHRLGLSRPLDAPFKIRHHVADGYRMAMAVRILNELGLSTGKAGIIGQDRDRVFFVEPNQQALKDAFAVELPTQPRRVKECASCRFWLLCEPKLQAADEISLFLPGDRARTYREKGINTVRGLINAGLGEPSRLAQAWDEGTALLRRFPAKTIAASIPRADIEVDVDMEAYLDQGAYLWGAWTQNTYHHWVTWQPLGGKHEAANFLEFWTWLMDLRSTAHAQGKTFRAYCYSSHGENHWMTMSATRFGEPALDEVRAFIASDEWVDVFALVRKNLAGPYGLGLKLVAPEAGFHWEEEDFDGEESVNARRLAMSEDTSADTVRDIREKILRYNRDDCRATAAVRDWLSHGAPGAPAL